jgi:catechol 2,3-dioxygenase-like lactoylglutathione lyase family enzyme
MARLEHVNVTVTDPDATAAVLCRLFGWQVRWAGPGMQTGRTVHVGDHGSYVALFSFGAPAPATQESYRTRAGLNHIGVVVEDLDAVEVLVKNAGYAPENHGNYEPGRRFYFTEENGVEIEVVCYG